MTFDCICQKEKRRRKMTLDCDAVLTDEKYDDLQCSQISLMYRLVFLLMEIKCHLLFLGLEDMNYKNF